MDKLCIQAIYMPLIRADVFDFVDSWNNHYIHRQRNRPNHPTGWPWIMYFQPKGNVSDLGVPVNRSYLDRLQNDIAAYSKSNKFQYYEPYDKLIYSPDLDIYLPSDILD